MCISGWPEVRVENAVPTPIPKDFDSLQVCLKHKPGNLHFLQSPSGDSDAGGPRCTIISRETKYLKHPGAQGKNFWNWCSLKLTLDLKLCLFCGSVSLRYGQQIVNFQVFQVLSLPLGQKEKSLCAIEMAKLVLNICFKGGEKHFEWYL